MIKQVKNYFKTRRIFIFFLLAFLFFGISTQAFADIQTSSSEIRNQIIVKFKKGLSPDELKAVITKKQKEKQTIVGFFKVFFADLQLQIQNKEIPEVRLQNITTVQKKAGVSKQEKLYKGTAEEEITYVITLKDGSEAKTAITLYKTLTEVVHAEPNREVKAF